MSTQRQERHVLFSGVLPRGLSRDEAARLVGVSTSTFDRLVADGRMPQPGRIFARKVWCSRAVNLAFDALLDAAKGGGESDPWDAF